ncbi:MAG: hypothetical protein AAB795_02090 [Patescibacteria group bacterium]
MPRYRTLIINKPHILILHEHHGNRYLLVKNENDLYRLALEILDWRFGGEKDNHGYYVLEKPEEPSKDEILSDEEISRLPSKDIQEFVRQKQKTYEKVMMAYRREKEKCDAVHETILKKDGKRAWNILQAMSNAGDKDDTIDFEPLETTYEFE